MDSLAQLKHWKMVMRFGTRNIRSLYRRGSVKMVARKKFGKYKLNLVGVQKVRWEKHGTEQAKDYTLSYGERNKDHQLQKDFHT
jgi:hypothetical protein